MEEVDDIPIVSSTTLVGSVDKPTSTPSPTPVIPTIPVVGSSEVDFSGQEGFSILQKVLFLAVILGCVAVYLKVNNKKAERFREKSMA